MARTITEIRAFYESRRGAEVRRLIGGEIARLWPALDGLSVAGLGYGPPFLGPFVGRAARVLALMPGHMGGVPWPDAPPRCTAFVEETALPLADAAVERLLLIHALETSRDPPALLREAWRVLAPEGRALVVVPNRRGPWAHSEATPFGHGTPYSPAQLHRLLRDHVFQPEATARALHVPPARWLFETRLARPVERGLGLALPPLAGVVIVEIVKRLSAGLAKPLLRPGLAAEIPLPAPRRLPLPGLRAGGGQPAPRQGRRPEAARCERCS